jgi:predicted AlkP superfamily pyrophosphatase or phosphodiesterase
MTVAGCGARYVHAPPLDQPPPLPDASLTRHVLLISVDGLRADAIDAFPAPVLQRLMREGSYSLTASTVMPSRTLPSHMSMLTGELPERHGVLWNTLLSARGGGVGLPTVFGVARAHGYRTAAFFSKSKFHALQLPGTLDFSQAPRGWFGHWSNERTVADVEGHLAGARPNLLFVHLPDPDRAGHGHGWMSVEYGRAVARTDAALARLLDAAERAFGMGQYTVIVTADHGGHGFDHGGGDSHDLLIPWIAWGRGVGAGAPAGSSIRTIDTASTVLWLLGVSEPTDWQGAPVAGAFGTGASD